MWRASKKATQLLLLSPHISSSQNTGDIREAYTHSTMVCLMRNRLSLLRKLVVFVILTFIHFSTTFRLVLNKIMTNKMSEGDTKPSIVARVRYQHHRGSAIFYNIYVNPSDPGNGIRIVKEQTLQMLQRMNNNTSKHLRQHIPKLYYNMIGYNYTEPFCPTNLTCIFLHWYEKAFEEVTLQRVHEYCTDHPEDVVYYLHNKGSFTVADRNEQTRREQTDFVFSEDAIERLQHAHNGTCNIVGTHWEAFPWWHLSGNFWLAKCSYVRKLLPPKEFQEARVHLMQQLLHPDRKTVASPYYCLSHFFNQDGQLTDTSNFSDQYRHVMGMDRFSHEHWLSSHPDVTPCDNADTVFRTTLLDFENTTYIKQLFGQWGVQYQFEWYRLHGRLFEMYQLYRTIPPNESFFWKYYQGTDDPLLPELCRQGQGRNFSAYYERLTS